MISVAIFGCGAVGSEIVNLLQNQDISPDEFRIHAVLVQNTTKSRNVQNIHLTSDYDWLVNSDGHNIVIDALPGVDRSFDLICRSLAKGYDVITCNKEVMMVRGKDLYLHALNSTGILHLNSIPASAEKTSFDDVDITHNNFLDFSEEELYGFKDAGPRETALYIHRDLKKIIKRIGMQDRE